MWERLSKPWRTCLEAAWSACCDGEGLEYFLAAAITDGEGNVLSVGAGHRLDGGHIRVFPHGGASEPCRQHVLAHAELQALLTLDYEHPSAKSRRCALYTTLEPCPLCIGAVCMCNAVSQLHYAARDPWAGGVKLLDTTAFMRRQKQKLSIRGPGQNPQLETLVVAVGICGSLTRGRGREHPVTKALCEMAPEATCLAEALRRGGQLEQWRQERLPFSAVAEHLLGLLQRQPGLG